ncbi:MAG: hypothetical protein IPJ06_01755 [Saprospiraceae bacterium]|nr:hypothetical protein [Saprospiraceae bacterium]
MPNNSWAWDVDNNGSTDYTTQNPSHTYSTPGVYSVKLTVNGGADDEVKNEFVLVLSAEPTVNTGCTIPGNSNNGNNFGIGIFRFGLNELDYTTPHNNGNYHNYVCTQWTPLSLNTLYTVTIQTGVFNAEGARVYIDYNDNGIFESGESVCTFPSNTDGLRTTTFTTPASGVTMNTGLRMRVLSKFGGIPTTACDISTYGQAEDYTVYFYSPPPPVLSIAPTDASKNEGNAGNTPFTFTVTRTGDTSGSSSASWAVTGSGGNPADVADFGGSFPSGTVSFAAAETSKLITVNVSGDMAVEPDEGFTVTISMPVNATIGTATATGTILNDDALPPPVLSIAATDANKNEGNAGNTPFTFTVTRTGDTSGSSSASWAVTGSGGNPANAVDFGGTFPSGTVSFAAMESSKVITANVSGDLTVEPDEGFTVTLSMPINATIGTATATGTILNDDVAACPTVADVYINEFHYDNTGTDANEFVEVVVRNTFLSQLADLTLHLYNGSNGQTYETHILNTFTAGTNDGTFTYYSKLIPGIQNGAPDGISLSCLSNPAFQFLSYEGVMTGTNGPANGLMSTDVGVSQAGTEPLNSSIQLVGGTWYSVCSANTRGLVNALPQVDIAPTDANKNEGNAGNTSFTFTVTRTGLLGATFTLNYAVTGSGANPANAADFGGSFPSGMVSFAANETSKVITVLVSGDLTVEPDETFTTTITQSGACSVAVTTGTATGTIINDDMAPLPVISIAATDAVKNEGNAGTTNFLFTVTRTGDLSAASSVNYTVSGSGANPADAVDFGGVFPTGMVNFAIGESSKPLNIAVNGDMSIETDDGFTVTLSVPVNATIGTGSATGTILNDDVGGYSWTISDPCSCNNDATPNNQDGTFGEEVTVMGPPNMDLVVGNGSTGLIGVNIGDPIPETPLGSGIYILSFDHLDAVGYTLNGRRH